MDRLIFTFICCIITKLAFCQTKKLDSIQHLDEFLKLSEKGVWKQAKCKKEICIRYRDIQIFEKTKTREISVSFMLKTSSEDNIINYLKIPNKITAWNQSLREVKLLKNTNNRWISHSKYNIPFPFSQQDLVAKNTLIEDNNIIIVYSKSIPNYISKVKGFKRESYNLSKWSIRKLTTNRYIVTFSAISLSNSKIPRFIKDPIIQKKLLNSFISLKELLAKNEKPIKTI